MASRCWFGLNRNSFGCLDTTIIGATLALGIAFALTAIAPQKDRTADIRAVSGPSAVLDVQAALREHLAGEYASVSGPSAVLDVQAALREHLAGEYGGQ